MPAIVKQLRGLYPSADVVARFHREFEITRSVAGPGVIDAYELNTHDGMISIVIEDFGAQALSSALTPRAPLDQILDIGCQVADALARIHRHDVIHKDINPANIVLNAKSGEVKLIDFGISQVLSRESVAIRPVSTFEGTPNYMSPEQTGRMNRVLDCRSDLYSLGATLYELATGRPPFALDDKLALVHAHIARSPEPPTHHRPDLPKTFSDIVMTLLEKRAEDRYQSAAGLRHDLGRCLEELRERGHVSRFTLRERDFDERLRIPQKLYGREAEVSALLGAFDRAADGAAGVVLVAGYSGIGKTSLVHEVHRSLAGRRGSFVEGKFDQFNRGTPYDSLIQAFRNLVRQILTEDPETIADWKRRIGDAVGSNGLVLTQVIPEAELVIGPQPEIEELNPAEARNRFQIVISNFVRATAWADHPLVIFVDDLQWADLPSIELIDRLASDPDTRHLLLIGAYRDNEVDETHPLSVAIPEMVAAGAHLEQISLGPLAIEDVRQLVVEALDGAPGHEGLAEQCFSKTRGNAFFLNRFIEGLYDEGLLTYDTDSSHWTWDPEAVDRQAITDNVVDFMSAKIRRLPNATQRAVIVAACIGNTFDLHTLANAVGTSRGDVLESLRDALRVELITPVGEGFWYADAVDESDTDFSWCFAHDRIRQAAYSVLEAGDAIETHLRIGRYMLKHFDETQRRDRLFELVEQLNRGVTLIDDPDETDLLCDLNLEAGRRATQSAAFAPAHLYYQQAGACLADGDWDRRYAVTLAIHVEGARAAYLSGHDAIMEERVDAVVERGKTVLDRVEAQEVRIYARVAQQRFLEAVQTAIHVLDQLGIDISETPTQEDVQAAVGGVLGRMGQMDAADFAALPEATDPTVAAAMRIQNGVMSSAYLALPTLLPILATNIVNATLDHGASKGSPYGFAIFALVLTAINMVDVAYDTGKIALGMLDRWDDRTIRPKPLHVVGGMVYSYVDPLHKAIDNEAVVFQLAIDTGDLEYAAWALHTRVCNKLWVGIDLAALEEQTTRSIAILEHHRQGPALACTYPFAQIVRNLTGRADDPVHMVGTEFHEQQFFDDLAAENYRGAAYVTSAVSALNHFLFRDLDGARHWGEIGAPFADGATVTYSSIWQPQILALARLGLCDPSSAEDIASTMETVGPIRDQLQILLGFSEVNHRQRVDLLNAEIARINGRLGEAMSLYDASIAAARANGFLHEEAMANELCGRFHLSRGSLTAARAYLMEACFAYNRWGASAKTDHLESEFAELLAGLKIADPTGPRGTATTTGTISTSNRDGGLDLDTLMKGATAISSEIRLESVLGKVMDVAIENAGATRGFLIMDDGGELRVDAAKDAEGNSLAASGIALRDCAGLPVSIVSYVARTGELLVLQDARDDPRWTRDPHVPKDRPTSILCGPVVNQGVRSGIVLLCNDLTAGAFTPARTQVMTLLSAQAAISIQNARLFEEQVRLTDAHSRFVPNQFLETLERKSIGDINLGDSVRKEMSILFSDMRAFTTHVEGLTGEESIGFINNYLHFMEPPIQKNDGFVDSYIGDAIMALFDAPDAAIRAGIEMIVALQALNAERAAAGKGPIQVGVGVNTGDLTLGTIGAANRFKCGVIGDCVNVAARVETLTKTYGVQLLTTNHTRARLPDPDAYCSRIVDRVIVKGKREPVDLHEIFDADPEPVRDAKLAIGARYSEAIRHYFDRGFGEARSLFSECGDDPIVMRWLDRCERYLVTPPPEEWIGVVDLGHK